jgi:hypothetical protein
LLQTSKFLFFPQILNLQVFEETLLEFFEKQFRLCFLINGADQLSYKNQVTRIRVNLKLLMYYRVVTERNKVKKTIAIGVRNKIDKF